MSKKKDAFIKKNLRPDLEIKPDRKISELTVRELSAILHSDLGPIKHIIDSKPFKDYKDNKDLIYEGPLNVGQSKIDLSKELDKIIKKISGLEKEIKKLKHK